MILDDMEANPEKYKGKKLSELTDDDDFDEENSVEYTKAYYKKTLLPKIVVVSISFCNISLKYTRMCFTEVVSVYFGRN